MIWGELGLEPSAHHSVMARPSGLTFVAVQNAHWCQLSAEKLKLTLYTCSSIESGTPVYVDEMTRSFCHQLGSVTPTHRDLEPDHARERLDLVEAELDRALALGRRGRVLKVPEERA